MKRMGWGGSFLAAVPSFLASMSGACRVTCCLDGHQKTTSFLAPLVSISCKNLLGLICASSRIRVSPFKEKGMCVLGINEPLLN